MQLAIDLETYSDNDIKFGVHKYVDSPNFEILLFAYKVDNGPIEVVDLANGEKIPGPVLQMIWDTTVLKTAYNASFEIACLSKHLQVQLDPYQWSCTQALAAQTGLPFGLDNVAKVLDTVEQKDKQGKELLKFFTMPCKPTKSNGMRTRNLPAHAFDKWLDFKEYARQDVATENAIRQKIKWFTPADFEKDVWAIDQKINNRGVLVDLDLVKHACEIDKQISAELAVELVKLTSLSNPKSVAQLKAFILAETGIEIDSLNKAAMPEVKKQLKGTDMAQVLKLREQLTRTSIKKFTAMENSVGADGRIRGLFQYYGANRTGRWAGRNVQLQNLKRNDLKDLDFARRLVKENKIDVLKLTYDDVGYVLSNLIRTAFIPKAGCDLIVSDFSAIEARVVAWFAGESWRLDVFKTHGKIYEASASMMFNIKLDDVTKDLRQKGKIAELALGYQGAKGALEKMGGKAMGLSDEDMARIVKLWRKANPKIVKFWYNVQDCFIEAIQDGFSQMAFLKFYRRENDVQIELPCGRRLIYIDAKYNGKTITYKGMDQTTKQWGTQDTYGGKLVENIVQATARDILTDSLKRLDKDGCEIIMHVHDEIVIESSVDLSDYMTKVLSKPLEWCPGLPLGAETFKAKYYQK